MLTDILVYVNSPTNIFCSNIHNLHTDGTHTVLGSFILLYIYTLVQSLFTFGLCALHNCTLGSAIHSFVTLLQNWFTNVR